MIPTKFSPVDAARLALSPPDPAAAARTPGVRDRYLVAATRLWCRELAFPTVRRLAAEVDRSPVTVLRPFSHMLDLFAEVIRREWDVLDSVWYGPGLTVRVEALADHALGLAAVDQALLRLPSLVHAAVIAGSPRFAAARTALRFSMPLYVLAAFADLDGGFLVPTRQQLRRALLAASRSLPPDEALWGQPA